jgi:metal-responsive CopG/Arc/MetJ family transcriptional regulator
MVVARKQVLVQLSDELVASLDRRARQRAVSRSQLIREAVEQLVADELAAERAYVESYTRFPQEDDPEADIATILTSRDMDEEEREAGFESW